MATYNSELVELKKVTELISKLPFMQSFFSHCGDDGVLYKATLDQLATFLTPYITAVGGSGFVATIGNALPAASAGKFTIVGAGTYTQTTGGNLELTNPINIIGWNGVSWILIKGIPLVIPDSKTAIWTAKPYIIDSVVLHLGKYWRSTVATVAGDIPGTSINWVEDLIGYSLLISKMQQSLSRSAFVFSGSDLGFGVALNSGYIDLNGVIKVNAALKYTDPINVKGQESITYIPSNSIPSGANTFTSFYNLANVSLSNVLNSTNGQIIPVPAGAEYLRTTVQAVATSVKILAGTDVDKVALIDKRVKAAEVELLPGDSDILTASLYPSTNGVAAGYSDLYNARYVEGDYSGKIVNGITYIAKSAGIFDVLLGKNLFLGVYEKTVLKTYTVPASEINIPLTLLFDPPITLEKAQVIGVLSADSTAKIGKSTQTGYGSGFYSRAHPAETTQKTLTSDLAYRYMFGGAINNISRRLSKVESGATTLEGKEIKCVGDSITAGSTSVNPYPTLLKAIGVNAINLGIAGTKMGGTDATAFVQRLVDIAPGAYAMILMGGTNDFLHNIPIGVISDKTNATFYGSVDMICNMMLGKFATSRCAFMTPIQISDTAFNEITGGVNTLGKKLIDYVAVIKERAAFYGIPVLDLSANCGINPNIAENKALYYAADGCHPTAAGDIKMFGKIRAFIESL